MWSVIVYNPYRTLDNVMALFSKIGDRGIRIVSVLYYPQHGGFRIISQRSQAYWRQFKLNGEAPVLMCIYRYANGDYDGSELMCKFMNTYNTNTGLLELSRADVLFIYAAWRRAYASGYDASQTFNFYGIQLPNPMIPTEQMDTFDVRLGYCVTMDGLATRAIGQGTRKYSAPATSPTCRTTIQ